MVAAAAAAAPRCGPIRRRCRASRVRSEPGRLMWHQTAEPDVYQFDCTSIVRHILHCMKSESSLKAARMGGLFKLHAHGEQTTWWMRR